MKRVLYMLALFPSLAFGFGATNLYQIPGGGTNMGWTRDGIQSNFQALVPYPGTGVTMTYTPSGVTFNVAGGSGTFTNIGVGASNAPLRIWLNNYVSNGITTTWFVDSTGGVYSVVSGASTGIPLYSIVWTSSICAVTNFYLTVLGSSTNYSQIISNQMGGCTLMQYWVSCLTNGSAGGGGSGGYTAIPTNPHGFRVMYVFNSGTNFSTFEGTKLILMTNAANVVYDTGIADGFGRPYWNTTNSTWSSPKGKSRVTHFADAQQGAVLIEGIGWNDSRTATNAFGANPAFEDKFAVWNILAPGALYGGIRGPFTRIWESPDATNTYYIFARCASGCYNLYGSDLTVEIITVEP